MQKITYDHFGMIHSVVEVPDEAPEVVDAPEADEAPEVVEMPKKGKK